MATYDAEIDLYDHPEYNADPLETFHREIEAEDDDAAKMEAKRAALRRMDETGAGAYRVTLRRDGEVVMVREP